MATQPLAPTRAGKYVTFQISRHYFAVDASRVRQVVPARDLLSYDNTLPCFRGILVVRGRRVPVLDIREHFGLLNRSHHSRSAVVLLETAGLCGLPLIGIVADRMTDVLDLRDRDFRGDTIVQLRPYGRPYGRPKTLLHIESVLTQEEISSLKSIF